jgi:hypothetical protein
MHKSGGVSQSELIRLYLLIWDSIIFCLFQNFEFLIFILKKKTAVQKCVLCSPTRNSIPSFNLRRVFSTHGQFSMNVKVCLCRVPLNMQSLKVWIYSVDKNLTAFLQFSVLFWDKFGCIYRVSTTQLMKKNNSCSCSCALHFFHTYSIQILINVQ